MTVQDEATSTTTHGVILTDAAACQGQGAVGPGGPRRPGTAHRRPARADVPACATTCSSTTGRMDGDLTVEFGGVKLTVDRMSAPYVQGATIDFVDTIEKQGFTIDNPNATGSCACGDSFN